LLVVLDNVIGLCYGKPLNPELEQTLRKMEKDAFEAYEIAHKARPWDGGAWDEGYWKGIKAAINVVWFYDLKVKPQDANENKTV
jgi:hypothetical protein